VEVRAADGTLIILDCGTGAHDLGRSLVASGERPIRGHLLLTHTHWDHIQGFPFFAPLFIPGNEWDVYAPLGLGQRLEDTLAGQMEYEYFPVTLGQLDATIRYHELHEGAFERRRQSPPAPEPPGLRWVIAWKPAVWWWSMLPITNRTRATSPRRPTQVRSFRFIARTRGTWSFSPALTS
jgi:glyoxylase-like metal-dependent hydrolase (beta-lactamase superfamily II)